MGIIIYPRVAESRQGIYKKVKYVFQAKQSGMFSLIGCLFKLDRINNKGTLKKYVFMRALVDQSSGYNCFFAL
jgi:hypothetical protein